MKIVKNIIKNSKKIVILLICIGISIFFSGCESAERNPISVTFIDVSGAMSADHTITINFSEEKNYEKYYIDILVKSDTDGVELTLFQEFAKDEDKVKINLNKDTGYISLDEYKLFKLEKEQTDSMVGYGDVLTTTIVVNSNKEAELTFLGVIGEKQDGNFKKVGEVSKEYTLKVRQKVQD